MAGEAYVLAARLEVLGGAEFGQKLDAAAGKVQSAVGKMEGAGKAGENIGKGFESAEKKAGLFEKAVGKVADTALRLATYKVLNEVGQWVSDVTSEFIGLDQAITNALAIQDGRADRFEGRYKSMARTLATDLGVSAKDVGEQFYFLASAGLSVDEQLEAVPVTTKLAKAGLIDMGKAAESVSQVFAIFKQSDHPKTFQEIADTLVQAANDSQGTIEQFTDSLTNKAGTAATLFGQTMEDTVAVLEAFAERGISGKLAGEQYAIVLRDLAIRAEKNKQAFKDYNIEVFDQQGKMKSILEIIPQLQRSLGGLSDEQRTAALTSLGFTLRSQNVISNLLVMGDRAQYFRDKLNGAAGAIDEITNKQLTGLQGKLDLLKSATIEIGFKGIDKLIELGDYLVEKFSPAFASLEEPAKRFAEGLGLVLEPLGSAAFAAAKDIIEGIATGIQKAGEFAQQHEGSMVVFGAVIGSIAAAYVAGEVIGLVGAGIKTIGAAMGAVQAGIGALQAIGPAIAAIGQASTVGGGLTAVGGALGAIGAAALPLAGIVGAVVAVPVALWALSAYQRSNDLEAALHGLEAAFKNVGVPVEDAGRAIGEFRKEVAGTTADVDQELAGLAVRAQANAEAARLSTKGLADEFSHLAGITTTELAEAILTGTNLFDDFNVTSDDTARQLEHIRDAAPIGPVRDLATAMLDAYNAGTLTTEQIGDLAEEFDRAADTTDDLQEKQAKLSKTMLETALQNGQITPEWLKFFGSMELGSLSVDQLNAAAKRLKEEASFEEILGQMNEVNPALDTMGKTAADARGPVNELGQTAEEAAEEFDTLKAAIDKLIDGPLSRLKGDIGVEKAFDDAAEAVKKLGGISAESFDIASEAGRKLYNDTLIPIADALKNQITTNAQGSAQALAQGYVDGRARLMEMLISMGLSIEAADELAAKVGFGAQAVGEMAINAGLIPGEIQTNVTTTDNGTTDATKAEIDATADGSYNATINTQAVTAQAAADINAAAANRATRIDLNLNAGSVPGDIDWIARQRQSGVTPVLDGWAAAKTNDDANWLARTRGQTDVPILDGWAAANTNRDLDWLARTRYSDIVVTYRAANQPNPDGTANLASAAQGGIFEFYAGGGMRENHMAQIAPAGTWRVWAEPETGGEAYIPLGASKRLRSMQIWAEVGRRLGVNMQRYAGGGMTYSPSRGMAYSGDGGGITVHVGANALSVQVAAAVGADPNHLAGLVTRQMRPALDEFAADLVTRIQRKKGRA